MTCPPPLFIKPVICLKTARIPSLFLAILFLFTGLALTFATPVHPRLFFGPEDVPALRARQTIEPYASIAAQIRKNVLSVDYPQRVGNMAFIYLLTQDENWARMAGLRTLDYISNLDRWENDNAFGLRRGIDITAVMLAYDFCYHSDYWANTIVPATVAPEAFSVNGVHLLVPGNGTTTDSTGKWHTAYNGRTITVPAKYVGKTLREAVSLALKLNADSNIRSGGSGWPGNDKPGNNWWAVRYGSALLAYLVSDEPGLIGSANYQTAIARLKTHLAANLSDSPLALGWNPEGISYAQYPGWTTYPAAIALKRLTGRDLVQEHPAMRYALWSTYMGVLPWERLSRLGHPVAGTGLGVKPDFDDDHNVWEGEGTAALAFAFAYNDDPNDAIPDFDYRPGLKFLFNRLAGAKGDQLWDSASGNGLYAYLYYPPDSGPGAIAEQNPDTVWGRTYNDPSYGVFVFRSGHQDADFSFGATGQPGFRTPSTDIVTQTTINLRPAQGGHDGPDAQSLRLYGLGVPWAVGSGRNWIIPAQTSLMPYDPTTMGSGTLGVVPFGNEVVDSFLRPNAGDGFVITRQSTSDTGARNHTRRLVVDYSGLSGAPALILTYDTTDETTAWWRLNTFVQNTVQTSVPGQFTITSTEGHRLVGQILYPPNAQTRTGTINRGNELAHKNQQHLQNRWVDFPLTSDGHALVAMVLVPSGQSIPTIHATGSKETGFTVTAGNASFFINPHTNQVLSPHWNPPSLTITTPTANQSFHPAPQSITVAGTATDDGEIRRMDIYLNDVLRHSQNYSAQTVNWGPFTLNGVPLGQHQIKVIATDNAGDTRTATVPIRLTNSTPPSVSITSPAASSPLFSGQLLTLHGRATDPDSTLSRVEIWYQNSYTNPTRLGSATLDTTAGTWTYLWPSLPTGTHQVWAVAFAADGDSTISPTLTLRGSLRFSAHPTWGDAAHYSRRAELGGPHRWSVQMDEGDLRLRVRPMQNFDYDDAMIFLRGSANPNFPNFRLRYRVKVAEDLATNPYYFTLWGQSAAGPVAYEARTTNGVERQFSWTNSGRGTRIWHHGNSGMRPEIGYSFNPHRPTDPGYPNNPASNFAGIPNAGWNTVELTRRGSNVSVRVNGVENLNVTDNLISTRGAVGLGNERNSGSTVLFDDVELEFLDATGNPIHDTPASITFSQPVPYADLPAGQSVTLSGTVADPDGIAAVELLAGAQSLGSPQLSGSSWSMAWTPQRGHYALMLRVTDALGFVTESPPLPVTVTPGGGPGGNSAPVITIAENTAITNALALQGTVSDADGSISLVQVFRNGTFIGNAAVTGGQWSLHLTAQPEGTHTFHAVAWDNRGASTASANLSISLTAPTASLDYPTPGGTVEVGQPAVLQVRATAAPGCTIASVEFFVQGQSIGFGTLMGEVYRLTWTPRFYGSYPVTARIRDSQGMVTETAVHTVTVVPDASPTTGAIVTYAGGLAADAFTDAIELSNGKVLVAGSTANPNWLATFPQHHLTPPAFAPANSANTAFLLLLSPDLATIEGVWTLPAGFVTDFFRFRTTNKPGDPTGAIYVSGTYDANRYFIGRLNANFVEALPTGFSWTVLATATGVNAGLQSWDVGGDGRLVYYDETDLGDGARTRVRFRSGTGQPLVLPNLRATHFSGTTNLTSDGLPRTVAELGGTSPSESMLVFPRDLTSAVTIDPATGLVSAGLDQNGDGTPDWEEVQLDENGNLRMGAWPLDIFLPVLRLEVLINGAPAVRTYGYNGYRSAGTNRIGGIAVDRETNNFFIGFNNQSRFYDLPNNIEQPDFEPAWAAFAHDGSLLWWNRGYAEVIDANNDGVIQWGTADGTLSDRLTRIYNGRSTADNPFYGGETLWSPPDQYLDGLAIDYSGADKALIALARCHGNNSSNFYAGHAVAASPGHNGFQNAFTGTEGNIHIGYLARNRLSDGTLLAATYLAGYFRDTVLTQAPYPQPIHDNWPSHNAGWANLTTTRAFPGSVRVDAQGRVAVVGTGPRMVTTLNAFQKLPRITPTLHEGIAPWHDFVRVFEPNLGSLVYSSALTGVWTYPSAGAQPVGAGNTRLQSVFPLSQGVLVAGVHLATDGVALGHPVPVNRVPAWGRSTPQNQTALLARLPYATSINIPPSVQWTSPAQANASIPPGGSITLTTTASDTDGSISKVEFYANGLLIGHRNSAPYSIVWSPPGAEGATYQIHAVAYDNHTPNPGTSTSNAVTVKLELAPTVTLTAPLHGSSHSIGSQLLLRADATDTPPGSVVRTEFFVNGNLVGVSNTAPYSFLWSPPALGSYTLLARAVDNDGAVGVSSTATISIISGNAPPTAAIQSPSPQSNHLTSVPVVFDVLATDGGQVRSVEILLEGTPIGQAVPLGGNLWRFSWLPDRTGHLTFTARATDNGVPSPVLSTVSEPVTLHVAPGNLPQTPGAPQATAPVWWRALLAWTDQSSEETGFEIQRRTGSGEWQTLAIAPANTTEFTDTSVAANTTYHYRVRALNLLGTSAWSSTFSLTTPATTATVATWNLGGNGTWDLTSPNWSEGGPNVAWSNDGSRTAAFPNANYSYTLTQPTYAAGLQNMSGTFQGGAGCPLYLGPGGLHQGPNHLILNVPVVALSDLTLAKRSDRNLTFNQPFIADNRTITFHHTLALPLADFTGTLRLGSASQVGVLTLNANTRQNPNLTIESFRAADSGLEVMANNAAQPAVLSGPVVGTGFIRANPSGGSTKFLTLDYSTPQTIPYDILAPGSTDAFLALDKTGPGTVTLTGQQIRNRRTLIREGVLHVNGSANLQNSPNAHLFSSSAIILAGAGFGGRGVWNLPATFRSGAQLALHDQAVAPFTFGRTPVIEGDLEWLLEVSPATSQADRVVITDPTPLVFPEGRQVVLRLRAVGPGTVSPAQEFAILTAEGGLEGLENLSWTLDLSATPWHGGEIYRKGHSLYLGNLSGTPAGLRFTEPYAGIVVSENPASPPNYYRIALRSQPAANVTVTIQTPAGLAVTPTALTFTPANWQIPQLVTVQALDNTTTDAGPSGWYERLLQHTLTSADPAYQELASRPLTVRIFDNEINLPPQLTRVSPQVADLYQDSSHATPLLFEVHATDELVLNPSYLSFTWQLLEKPNGSTAQLSSNTRSARLTTDLDGTYRLRVTVSDQGSPALTDSLEYTIRRGNLPHDGPTDSSLRAWLKMDTPPPATTIPDSSGTGNHATRTNGSITLGQGRSGTSEDGAFVGASNAFLTIAQNTSLYPQTGFTHSLWFRANQRQANAGLIHYGRNQNALFTLYWDAEGRLNSRVVSNQEDLHTFNHAFTNHQWYHVAVVYNPALPAEQRVALYVNGELEKYSPEASTSLEASASDWALTIGRTYDTGTVSFDGLIDDYRYYVRPLGAEEIRQVHRGINRAPALLGAASYQATAGQPRALSATLSDSDSTPTLLWRQVSGPGLVQFSSTNTLTTEATFGTPGTYQLELLANDANGAVTALPVTVTVTGTLQPLLQLNATNGRILSQPAQTIFPNTSTTVTLTPVANNGFVFSGWEGDVPENQRQTQPLTLLMDRDRAVTARFEPVRYTITANAQHGAVVVEPFAADYAPGAALTLQAFAEEGYYFAGWEGDVPTAVQSNNPVQIFLDTNKSVTARILPYRTISVSAPYGTVTRTPHKTQYRQDETVVVNVLAHPGYHFTGWSGSITSTEPTLTLLMNNNWVLTAEFVSHWQSWLAEQFGTNATENMIAPTADPDGDGLPNLLEYALGGNPLTSGDHVKIPLVGTTSVAGQNRLTLSFTPAATIGLRYLIETSADLIHWAEASDITAHLTPGQPYTFTDSANLATTPRRFLRLRVLRE